VKGIYLNKKLKTVICGIVLIITTIIGAIMKEKGISGWGLVNTIGLGIVIYIWTTFKEVDANSDKHEKTMP
jgi:hypothetical protein